MVKFRTPPPRTSIRAGQAVVVSGILSGLPPDSTLWLVVTSTTQPGQYHLISNQPVATEDGEWQLEDRLAGERGTSGETLFYVAVQAKPACQSFFLEVAAINSSETPVALPSSCIARGSVAVLIA
jgi:hypothetical protein